MEKLEKIANKIQNVEKKFDETSLALEMLKELKKSSQRKFIIIVILIIALVGTNIGWLLYESQFETETETEEIQYMDDLDNANNSNFTQTIN